MMDHSHPSPGASSSSSSSSFFPPSPNDALSREMSPADFPPSPRPTSRLLPFSPGFDDALGLQLRTEQTSNWVSAQHPFSHYTIPTSPEGPTLGLGLYIPASTSNPATSTSSKPSTKDTYFPLTPPSSPPLLKRLSLTLYKESVLDSEKDFLKLEGSTSAQRGWDLAESLLPAANSKNREFMIYESRLTDGFDTELEGLAISRSGEDRVVVLNK